MCSICGGVVAWGQGLVYVDADVGSFDGTELINGVDNLAEVGQPNALGAIGIEFSAPSQNDLWDVRGPADIFDPSVTPENFGLRELGDPSSQQSVFASGGRGAENAPELVQTLSGLSSGTSYDVYAVYWSPANADWSVRAGFSSNPGGNQAFNRFGTFPDETETAIAGTLASTAVWSPVPDGDTDNPFTTAGNLDLYIARIGAQSATPAGEIDVFVDDLSVSEFATTDIFRTWYDGLAYVEAGVSILPTATIDRNTGSLTISSPSPVAGYSVDSAAGELDASQWNSLANGSNSSLDSDTWVETAAFDLALQEAETPANDGLSFDNVVLGNVWRQSPFEDTVVTLSLADGSELVLDVEFAGDEIARGDLNSDGQIDVSDYQVLVSNLHAPINIFTSDTPLKQYQLGDLTGDASINYQDLVEFGTLFEAANPGSSFAQISVPEPGAWAIAAIGLFALVLGRQRRSLYPAFAVLIGTLTVLGGVQTTSAQSINYFDAVFADQNTPTGNTRLADGTLMNLVPGELDVVNTQDYYSLEGTINNSGNTDLNWGERVFAGTNDGAILVGPQSAGGDAPELVTAIDGLAPGSFYDIFAYYWVIGQPGALGAAEWQVAAGFTSGDLTTFDSDGDGGLAGISPLPGDFVSPVSTSSGGDTLTLLQASVGVTQADDNGFVNVFVDDISDDTQRTWYDGLGFRLGEQPSLLSIEVDRGTGLVRILNEEDSAISLDYYELRSDSGSLSTSGWLSLDDQDAEPDTFNNEWDEAGGSSSSILSEVRGLGEGSEELAALTGELSLGNAFQLGGAEDLEFLYGLDGGSLITAAITYVGDLSGLPGDYNDDGMVDAADYTVWRDNLNGDEAALQGNGDGSGIVDQGDYTRWANNFGASSASTAASVPEPSSLLVLLAGGLAVVRRRSRAAA